MTGRRKGTPCSCETDPCSCGSSKGKCIRAINNISPDPNGDFNVNAGTGIIISSDEYGIVIANGMPDPASLVAGDNIEINAVGDDLEISLTQNPVINGDLTVNGDIIQNGAAYETHAEHIYTADDYIIMRDGAISALSAGDYSGFQVKLYDGVNDGRLVIDNSGTARVGDVGDEQPLMTRDESADLTDGDLLKWDAANSKAIDAGKPIVTLLTTFRAVSVPYDTLTNLTSLIAPTNGTYLIQAHTDTHVIGTGTEIDSLALNIAGSTIWMRNHRMLPGTYQREGFTYVTTLNQGDVVKLQAQHTLNANAHYYGEFALIRLN